ncbi:MAG: rhomboid family intramembrane serine protease [Desulfosarcinaceae bacterium]|nr:rhomboid family intramembrane serine protease [Desulfosarcinaceae bacterium]
MTDSKRNSILCPQCRRLVSRDEARCPYCGHSRPGAAWKNIVGLRSILDGDQLIRVVIAVNIAFFLLTLLFNTRRIGISMNPLFLLAPESTSLLQLGATGTLPIDQAQRWWTLLSANYLHGGLLHILFNMMALRQVAGLVDREFGTQRMFSIYTLSGVIGFYISYLAGVPFTIGASAAVCGLIGAAIYYGWSRGGIYGQAISKQLGGWAIAIFVFGVLVPGINNWGHGGGMLAGALLAALMGYTERRSTGFLHRLAFFGCLIVTLVVLTWALGSGLYYRFLI